MHVLLAIEGRAASRAMPLSFLLHVKICGCDYPTLLHNSSIDECVTLTAAAILPNLRLE